MSAPVSSSSASVLSLGTVVAPAGAGVAVATQDASAAGVAASPDLAGLPQGNDFESILSPLLESETAASTTGTAALLKDLKLAIGQALGDGKAGAKAGAEVNVNRKPAAAGGSASPHTGNALPAGELPVAVIDLATRVGAAEGLQAMAAGTDDTALLSDDEVDEVLVDASQLLPDGVLAAPTTLPSQAVDAAVAMNATLPTAIETAVDATDESLLPALGTKEASAAAMISLTADAPALKDNASNAAVVLPAATPLVTKTDMDASIDVDTAPVVASDLELSPQASPGADVAGAASHNVTDATDKESFGRLLSASVSQAAQTTGSDVSMTTVDMRMPTGAIAYRMQGQEMVATTVVPQPFGDEGWSDQVSDRVVWFSSNRIHHAEIELDPPELGPLQVRISTQNDQTTVSFVSHHAAVRDVLDQNLPKLRELFADQGLNLVQADVSERHGASRDQQGSGTEHAAVGDASVDEDAVAAEQQSSAPVAARTRVGLVDAFA